LEPLWRVVGAGSLVGMVNAGGMGAQKVVVDAAEVDEGRILSTEPAVPEHGLVGVDEEAVAAVGTVLLD
jgi:hypothetical protein